MADKELTVKVKLTSDQTNIGGPVGGMPRAGSSGLAPGSPNASVNDPNNLAQKSAAAQDALQNFHHHLNKATESLNALKESSNGVFNAFKQLLPGLAGGSHGGGILSGAWSAGKQFLGKYGMPLAVGGGALGIAGGIVSGVNAADNFFTSRGEKPWLGHGGWDRDASGRLYDWSPTRLWNQFEVFMIGGGKINARGDIRTNDQMLGQQHLIHSERMRRFQMGSALEGVNSNEFLSRFAFNQGNSAFASQFQGFDNYAHNVGVRSANYAGDLSQQSKEMVPLLNQLYGNNYQAQGELALHMQGITQQGRSLALQRGQLGVQLFQNANRWNATLPSEQEANANYAAKVQEFGAGSGEAQEALRAKLEVQKELKRLAEEELSIKKQIKETERGITEIKRQEAIAQSHMLQQFVNQERAGQDQSKLAYGSMAPGRRMYVKGVLDRFDSGGKDAVSPNELATVVAPFRKRETDEIFRNIADQEGFTDKGTLRDRAIDAAQKELDKKQNLVVELGRQIDVKLELDNKELMKEMEQWLKPLISNITIEMKKLTDRMKEIAEGQFQMQGQAKVQP